MRLDVPFHRQESDYDCGPAALKMALDFFGDSKSMSEIKDLLEYSEGDAVFTVQLATAAEEIGHEVEFYTAEPDNDHDDKEFHREHAVDKENGELYREAEDAGTELKFESISLEEIKKRLREGELPIVLVDWNILKDREGYQGHFLPFVGFESGKVLVHNPDAEDGSYMEIEEEMFEEARKADGTDQDIALIKK
ncbi:MAG: peptidase C39 family protein [Nanohaloarchaea archaeon]|nr:peptidase C39 family protein [Candidatus Nanohaloarchaea archaeon]